MSRNSFIVILIVGTVFIGICLKNIISSEYFLATSEEGIGVVKEIMQDIKYRHRGGMRASRAVPVQMPIITFKNPKDGKEYTFTAQEYEHSFPGRVGDSVYIHYKITGNTAEGVIAQAPGTSTFLSRNKINLICLAIGLIGTLTAFVRARRKTTSE